MANAEKPLAGKRIVITRAPEQAPTFVRALNAAGADVTILPCIDFVPPGDWSAVDSALSRLPQFDWIAFTSQNTVRFFSRRARELNLAPLDLRASGPKIAALGTATAEVAGREGLPPDFIASTARSGSEFVAAFASRARGAKVLLPASDQAGDRIAEALRAVGADVTSVVAYRTCMPESLDGEAVARIRREGADLIFFGSPSAVRNFVHMVNRDTLDCLMENSAFGAIGPTTAQAIRDAGIEVGFESPQPNTSDIIQAMTHYFASRNREKARK
ncbi:MAG TPA: uroporphyrinogen-III synthase [Candidatus Acidoferrales bacterium]